MVNYMLRIGFCLFMSGFLCSVTQAQTTGKIAGRVIDAETKEPLPNVNVTVPGTHFGAAADREGNFFILNIPPGVYSLRVQYVGYETQEAKNFRVSADLTTTVNFALRQVAIELAEIVVTENRTLVQTDLTASRSVINAATIEVAPLKTFQDVLKTQAGFSTDAEGGLHLRGGRTGEIAFFIDGVPVSNPSEGGFGGVFNNDAINELQVLSGTFNAEFGNAQSGVVHIITKEGSSEVSGKIEYTSAQLGPSPYRQQNAIVKDRNPEVETGPGQFAQLTYQPQRVSDRISVELPFTGTLNGYLSGPIPIMQDLSFFFSGRYLNEDSQMPHGFTLDRAYFGKITYRTSPLKLTTFADVSRQHSQAYNHLFKYRPDLQRQLKQDNRRLGISLTHVLSPAYFYTVNLSRAELKQNMFVPGMHPDSVLVRKLDSERMFVIGGSDLQSRSTTVTYTIKTDFSYQYGAHHLLKAGFDLRLNDVRYNGIRPLTTGGIILIIERVPTNYFQKPVELTVYAQDKIELGFLIANVGLRFDAVDVRTDSRTDIQNLYSPLIDTKPKAQLSPRVGLALPISEITVLHFAYGHFFQNAPYGSKFTGLDLIRDPHRVAQLDQPYIGNPDAKPQKTVAFEVGLQTQAGNNYLIKATSFYRDINNLLGGAGSLRTYDPNTGRIISYAYLDNVDFANVKGLEVTISKPRGKFFSGEVNYTLAFAKGSNATVNTGIVNVFTEISQRHRDFYLDFDRRHTINANLLFRIPEGLAASFPLAVPIENTAVNLIIQYASGFPYTPRTDDPTVEVEPNSARQPWNGTVDLHLERVLRVAGVSFVLYTDVNNLFDRINPLRVNPRSGRLWEDGRNLPLRADFIADPAHAGLRRSVKVGMKLLW